MNTHNNTHNNTLPWIEKYRPKKLTEILSHTNIINTLKECIKNEYLPHTLLYGPPGTGKTSTILAFARELYGKYYNFMVMELNASDDRGIEIVRDKIKKFVSARSVFFCNGKDTVMKNTFKLVILDETDAMTDDAQAILRKVIEEYSNNTRFCLICNYIQKILPALQSRCTKFRFAPLTYNLLEEKIKNICLIEKIEITQDGIKTVIKHSDGDMRKTLNILQSVSMIYNKIDENNINTCKGYPTKKEILDILEILINNTYTEAFNYMIDNKLNMCISLSDIIFEIHETLLSCILENTKIKNMNIKKIMFIIDKLRDIDFYQSSILNDSIQLSAVIGIFKLANEIK